MTVVVAILAVYALASSVAIYQLVRAVQGHDDRLNTIRWRFRRLEERIDGPKADPWT